MTNLLLDSTATRRIDIGLPWLKQIRVGDDLYAWLNNHKPADDTWKEWSVGCMVIVSLQQHIMARRLLDCIRQGVRLVGYVADDPTPGLAHLTDVSRGANEHMQRAA